MNDENPWKRNEIESPCVRICVVHPEARICTGCYRTTDEIARWSRMSAPERREIERGALAPCVGAPLAFGSRRESAPAGLLGPADGACARGAGRRGRRPRLRTHSP